VGPVARQIATLVLSPDQPEPPAQDTKQVRTILEALQKGKIERGLFTENANTYFSETALQDAKTSLAPLGKLKNVTASGENLRGGMTHRGYRAEFDKKTLSLNVYLTAAGKFEQFLVTE
jgi:hypothetical protein